ncbi:ABC transporter ATP-binding protein [Variovorax sp.]|jgi:branched-chain amino acid transport system ATP-binding protein|uniref:ABC transporter ATP-binding protein n=1 Tax=Variovorax sp. TaxID=1871043 RepID=UPI000C37886F|nr:ABC transporter ATP-binding protein [Variovorax sp.]MBS80745.1 ABC transporter ATP-binding protein [Variovorax sp.]
MTLAIQVTGLTKRYGGVTALNAVQLSVPASSIAGIIGPNGAGKSTFFDLVNGIIEPSSGGVTVMGHPLAGLAPHQVAALGVARTFQRTAVFAESSVIENLAFGRHMHMRHGVVASVLRTRRARDEIARFEALAEDVMRIAELPTSSREMQAGTLAYGQQRRLAVAIALMSEPRILLLDEPAAGMNTQEKLELVQMLRGIAPGRTLLIVEHDMATIESLCDEVHVFDDGRLVVSDSPRRVFEHPEVIEAYLGAEDDE